MQSTPCTHGSFTTDSLCTCHCASPIACEVTLETLRPSLYYRDTQTRIYDPRSSPARAFFNTRLLNRAPASASGGADLGADGFAQYKRAYHAYLHLIARQRGISISRAWEEMEVRRWRWELEVRRVRGELAGSKRKRRGAI